MKNILSRGIKIGIIGLFVFCAVSIYGAFKIPEYPQNYLNDYAGVLEPSQERILNNFLKSYDTKTTNQIFIGIFDSLQGESLEDLSIRIAEKWKPGTKDKDNGLLLLVFLKDRKMRIEVGYGLEHLLTDALATAIIANEISPSFRKGDYYGGVSKAVFKITKVLSKDFSPEELQRYTYRAGRPKRNPILSLLFLVGFIILAIRHPFLALLLFSGGFSSGGRYSGGGGFFGGGGGSFGGGGASGSW